MKFRLGRFMLLCPLLRSCENIFYAKYGPLTSKINHYETYNELISHFYGVLDKNIHENRDFYIPNLLFDNHKIDYFVGGIDYSYLHLKDYEKHKEENSDYLSLKGVFYELRNDSDLIVTLVFKNCINFEKDKIYWTDEKLYYNGTYEKNALVSTSNYLLYGSEQILCLKFNTESVTEETVEFYKNQIYSQIANNF